jgi:hypothetical protein
MTMLEKGLNYLYILYTKNNIAKSLPYEEEVKVPTPKKCIESTLDVRQAAN